jgi:hypothetical protein
MFFELGQSARRRIVHFPPMKFHLPGWLRNGKKSNRPKSMDGNALIRWELSLDTDFRRAPVTRLDKCFHSMAWSQSVALSFAQRSRGCHSGALPCPQCRSQAAPKLSLHFAAPYPFAHLPGTHPTDCRTRSAN